MTSDKTEQQGRFASISMVEQTKSITSDMLRDYLSEKSPDGKCDACGHENWEMPHHEGMPTILSIDLVKVDGMTNWFFPLYCGQCGNTRMIAAGFVWKHYFEVKKDG